MQKSVCVADAVCCTHGAYMGTCLRAGVGLPFLENKEKPHNSCLFRNDHSTDVLKLVTLSVELKGTVGRHGLFYRFDICRYTDRKLNQSCCLEKHGLNLFPVQKLKLTAPVDSLSFFRSFSLYRLCHFFFHKTSRHTFRFILYEMNTD